LRNQSAPSDDDLSRVIAAVWQARTDRYSEQRAALRAQGVKKVEMSYIGG